MKGAMVSALFCWLKMTIPEIVTYFIVPLFAAIAAAWGLIAWYTKQVTPAKLAAADAELQAKLKSLEDSREHKQQLENERVKLDALSASWANEKLFEEAHDNNLFIRTDVSGDLKEIKAGQRKQDLHLQQLESKLTLLIGVISEMHDTQRQQHGLLGQIIDRLSKLADKLMALADKLTKWYDKIAH